MEDLLASLSEVGEADYDKKGQGIDEDDDMPALSPNAAADGDQQHAQDRAGRGRWARQRVTA